VKPLSGIRIVDLTRLLPGPLATLLLSDRGSEVIKVEEPPAGDPLRAFPPLVDGTAALFHALNRGKRFVALDLRRDAHRERLLRILADADCLVEGFRPGVMARLGLDPSDLVARFERLTVARMSGFGAHGPWADRAGHDLGYLALTGALDRAPAPHPLPVQVADVGGAMLAVIALLGALLGRVRGRPADRILDVPLLDGAMMFAFPPHAREAAGDDVSPGSGLLEGGLPTYRMYADAEGRHAAAAALEAGPVAALAAFAGGTGVEAIAAAFSRVSALDLSAAGRLPPSVEPVLSMREAREHPAVRARGLFRRMDLPGGRGIDLPITPFAARDEVPPGPWARPVGADDATVSV